MIITPLLNYLLEAIKNVIFICRGLEENSLRH
nr:MAG TPA: hypothetical protein [Bacteriophage sp.]